MFGITSKNLLMCIDLLGSTAHAFFLITGEETASACFPNVACRFKKLVFPAGKIAQTSWLELTLLLLDKGKVERYIFLLMSDLASAQYLWEALLMPSPNLLMTRSMKFNLWRMSVF